MRKIPYVFVALGVAFLAIGFSNRRAFIFIGIAFLMIALIALLRSRS